MRPFGHVAQITPYPFSRHGEDMPIGRQASHQEGALDASQDLGGDIAPQQGYDEPGIVSYAIRPFCPTSPDGLQVAASWAWAPHSQNGRGNGPNGMIVPI
jgi:hypothetical protein